MHVLAEPEQIVRMREGSLREVPLPELFHALAATERTVVLEIRRKSLNKRIVIEGGIPVDCRSNLVHETFGRFLVAIGRIPEEVFQQTFQESVTRGVPQGEILSERGVIAPMELFKLLQQNLAKKLLDGFGWRDGEFRMLFDVPEVESPLKVKVPQLIVTGITRFSQQEEVDATVAPLVSKILQLHPQPPISLDEIRLGPSHGLLVASLATGRRLDELAALPGLSFEEVSRLVYALRILRMVLPADELRALGLGPKPPAPRPAAPAAAPLAVAAPTAGPPAAAIALPSPTIGIPSPAAAPASAASGSPPPPAPLGATQSGPATPITPAAHPAAAHTTDPAPAAGPAGEAPPAVAAAVPSPQEVERQRNEIMQAFLAHRRQDAFDLLAVPELVTATEANTAYVRFAQRYAWWTWTGELATLADKGQELFLAGARAYGQLCDVEQRNTLLFRRKTLRDEKAKKPAADFAIKTDLLDSELQFRRGMLLVDEGKLKDALQLLEFAADCDPGNGRYRAEAARCKWQLNPLVGGRQAVQDLREAIRMDPQCGIAHFYAGEIHKDLGNLDDAEQHFQRAIKLMSPDRRPIDALRNLRTKKR